MGKVPIRLKEVVYTLSPFQQSVMNGLWKDLPHKAAHHMHNVRGGAQSRGLPHPQSAPPGGGRGGHSSPATIQLHAAALQGLPQLLV